MIELRGTGVALVTPFKHNGSVDDEALVKLVEHLISNKVEYLVVLGTTGETATLNSSEKKSIFQRVREINNNRLPLIAGIGGNCTAEVAETMKDFDFSGYAAYLSVSPYYNKPNQSGLIRHYELLADKSPLPVLLYNVPSRTGQNMTAETTLKLAQHRNIIGVKEASGNFEQCMTILENKPEKFLVISGDDALSVPLLSLGMDGVISVIANAYPRDFSEMVRMALNGNYKAAREYHYRLFPLMQSIFADGSPGGVKEILNYMGICGRELRLPLDNVSEPVKKKLLELAEKY